jgi:hypothetical protein
MNVSLGLDSYLYQWLGSFAVGVVNIIVWFGVGIVLVSRQQIVYLVGGHSLLLLISSVLSWVRTTYEL